jgi:type IX secretion system PorP/SprF family membrane protein
MNMIKQNIYRIVKETGLVMLIVLSSINFCYAQQEPAFIQYNFNTQVYNPAYAGTWDNLGFLVLGRQQWAGIEGAPRTFTLSVQSPTRYRNVALGANLVSDMAGFENRTQLNIDYSYRLQLNRGSFLRLGFKGGITSYSVNFSEYVGYPGDPPDPMFIGDIDNKILPNFGVGAYLYNEDYYLGFSVPKILQYDFKNNYNNYSTSAEMLHFFFIGGYVYEISREVQFKPTFLTRMVWGAPAIFDLSANFLLREMVWLGANYRLGDSFGLVAQWIFDNNLRIGYGVEFTTARLRTFHSGTHEVMVSYEFGSRRKWSSPRMF